MLAGAVILAAGAPGRLGIGLPAVGANQAAEADLVVATRPDARPLRSLSGRPGRDLRPAALERGGGIGALGPDLGRSTHDLAGGLARLRRGGGSPADGGAKSGAGSIRGPSTSRSGARSPACSKPGMTSGAISGSSGCWPTLLALALGAVALGPWLAVAPPLCAATAIAGSLAGLRLAGGLADVSLLGIAPAAVLGLALGIEAPCLLVARFRDEAASVAGDEAIRRVLGAASETALPLALAAIAATAGLLATSFDQAPSMVLACSVAAVLALGSALICVPALLALSRDRPPAWTDRGSGEPPLARVPSHSGRIRDPLAGSHGPRGRPCGGADGRRRAAAPAGRQPPVLGR